MDNLVLGYRKAFDYFYICAWMPACFFGIRMINPIYFQIFYIFTFMRTSLFLGMTGFAFLTTFGLQGCSDDEGGNDGKNPPPHD
ncbi:hypothetical protein F2X65_02825 [Alistipes onderdonkii]|uniref:Transmembrane protein n=1 Tax=Alistipes onderdonkii TaxID=328813 RepID=A0AAJ1FP64_9BACT|nr:hypothetical protein [Alistipes onderdonkii]KAA2426157.1 hypothetical protein F2X90_02420 [Alistipes onderdonkii]KAA2460456.1 hypothetical protein F2X65_02825 [Alistipes onderdonkii]KAA2481835.1 hypothetical protein F2Y01_07095 [Alistipes onderdonkii]KAA2516278.1 hypothetical protein F2X50_05655 [Alistipes onderdonkii]KAA2533597.1 hypothetical protein F2S61_07200 [Alistipes onderdonkii]